MGNRRSKILIALSSAAAATLLLGACSGGGGTQSESGAESPEAAGRTTLRVVDYYFNEPDKQYYQEVLDACAADLDVDFNREIIPGDELVAKVLQMASSKTLPDVLMIDNPEIPQIAATGALTPLDELGLSAEGEAQALLTQRPMTERFMDFSRSPTQSHCSTT